MLMNQRRRTVLVPVIVVILCVSVLPTAAQSDTDAAWQRMLEGITVLSNLALIRDAVETLNAGGEDARALIANPKEFLERGGLAIDEGALVLVIDMVSNEALTQPAGTLGDAEDGFALSEVAIAFSGPARGVLVHRKVAVDATPKSFEEAAVDMTLWIEQSLGYIARVVHRLEEEDDQGRIDFFLAAPTEFFVEEAVEDKELGTGITFSFFEQSHITAYDVSRASGTEEPKFLPPDLLSEPGTVSIAIGCASENWSVFVELAKIDEF